jgi:hypothetical protein
MRSNTQSSFWIVNFSQVILVAALMFIVKRGSSILLGTDYYFTVGLPFSSRSSVNPWGTVIALFIDLFLHLLVGIVVGTVLRKNPEGTASCGLIIYRLFLASPIIFYWDNILGKVPGVAENRIPFLIIYFGHFIATFFIIWGGAKVGRTLRDFYDTRVPEVKFADVVKQLYSKEIVTGIVVNIASAALLKLFLLS